MHRQTMPSRYANNSHVNPIARLMRRVLTWVHGEIACIVGKLTAVSVKTILSSASLALVDNRQSATFKLKELEFRFAAYAKQSIGLLPQPASPLSPTCSL